MNKIDAIRRALAENAQSVAIAVLGQPNRAMSSKTELRFGTKGSLSIIIAGPKKGVYFDHEAGVGNDLIDLIERKLDIGFKEALAAAERIVGSPEWVNIAPIRKPKTADAEPSPPGKDTRNALTLWGESRDLLGTPAEYYLASRSIHVLPEGIGHVLRFHPNGPFGPGVRVPMLVALCRDIHTNEPHAVHRTALTAAGVKIGRKYLGPKASTAIKLIADQEVAQGLVIGEGIETTLAAMALGLRPAWAVGDANGIGNFPILAGIDGLTILVDHDPSGTGQMQSAKCRDRWLDAGREVLTVLPDQVGRDINDLIGPRK